MKLSKHRDYLHGSYFDHEMDNGGSYTTDPRSVKVDHDPIDYDLFDPSEDYYFVDLRVHEGTVYRYLIPAEGDNSAPNRDTLKSTVDAYVSNPIRDGRDWFDYLDLSDESTTSHPAVRARIEKGDNQKRPKAIDDFDDDEDLKPRKRLFLEDIL